MYVRVDQYARASYTYIILYTRAMCLRMELYQSMLTPAQNYIAQHLN